MSKNPIFRFFSSLKLAIFLLLTLAASSILGTLLPQGQPIAFYFHRYGPTLGKIIKWLHLYDTYHSWWYTTLLALFSINLILCSWKRFPFSLELYRRDPLAIDLEKLKRMPVSEEIHLKQSFETALKRVEEIVNKRLGQVKKISFDKGFLFLKDKARWSYFSVYIVHLSILIILIGGIIGSIWGFRGSIMLLEGESTNKIVIESKHRKFIPLDFEIKCNKFYIDFYPNGMPKEYRSDVTILENGKKVLEKSIKVNKPLTYKGITFYQANYQSMAEVELKLFFNSKEKEFSLKPYGQISWQEAGIRVGMMDFARAHGLPAAKIWLMVDDEAPQAFWILAQHPRRIMTKKGPLVVILEDVKPVYATGLQVKKDPGVWLVWIGFIFLILGVFAAFFFTHQRYWVAVIPEKNSAKVILAGMTPKSRQTILRKIEEIREDLVQV